MKKYLLAHDLGTSGNKATLFTVDGELIKSITSAYDTHYSHGNWAEQNPDDWWKAVCDSTNELLAGIDSDEIGSVCFSGQMMGCLPVDRHGRPLRTHLLYCDQRATVETENLLELISAEDIFRITGHRPSPSYAIEKLMWIKKNQPEIYRNTWKMVNAKDYMNFKLTGRIVTEHNDASGTNAFDLGTLDWSEPILKAAGIERDKLPESVPSTTVIGAVTGEAAKATGLRAGTPVVAGAGDGGCATVGIGSVKPGITYNYLGSSSWISTTSLKPVNDPEMQTFTWAHPVSGYLQPCGTMQTAGSSYSWLKEQIAKAESQEASRTGESAYEIINSLIEQSPPGANGILFLPYLLGERSPRWNPDAKGAFIGLSLEHKREDLFRSVLEGVTQNLGIILDIFKKEVQIDEMLVIGGGARGAVWRQIMADVYGIPVSIPNYLEEATSMGAAIIGGVGADLLKSFDEVDKFISITGTTTPIEENVKIYKEMRPLFNEAYFSLEPLFSKL
ncbi:MAG: xylulokinase [Spirochaetales bacterium]|nr:xylulokinase [Spirochaetales bacterium]